MHIDIYTQAVRLASGKTLSVGQHIKLSDKVRQGFPRLKGNVLPVRNFKFCEDASRDFKYVQLLIGNREGRAAHQSLGLVEDTIVEFTREAGVWYIYTHFFKIALEPALHFGEVKLIDTPNTLSANAEKLGELLEDIRDTMNDYLMGFLTDNELENRILDRHMWSFLHRQWEFKAARMGLRGGTAADIMDVNF